MLRVLAACYTCVLLITAHNVYSLIYTVLNLCVEVKRNIVDVHKTSFTYSGGYDDRLEPVEDWFDGYRCIHTAKPQHWVGYGGRSVIKWLNYQRETCKHHTNAVIPRMSDSSWRAMSTDRQHDNYTSAHIVSNSNGTLHSRERYSCTSNLESMCLVDKQLT